MNLLYAPWRDCYTKKIRTSQEDKGDVCIFCQHVEHPEKDEEHLVLGRYEHHYIVMNKYPYNAGHLLIIPYKHKSYLHELSLEVLAEQAQLVAYASKQLMLALKNEGFNIGMNMGKFSGAGIPEHLHAHIVPRWPGDTNFLLTVCDTKQISIDMLTLYKHLSPFFEKE